MLPIATYIMLTEPLGERVREAIRSDAAIGDDRRAGNYYRVLDGGRIGWGSRITTRIDDPPDLAETLRRELLSVYPQLQGLRVETAWSGRMAYARHLMPQIGLLAPDVWYCTAFGGHGMNTASMAAAWWPRASPATATAISCSSPSDWPGTAARWAGRRSSSHIGLIKRATGGGSAGRADRVYRCKATNRACWHNGCEPCARRGTGR